MGRRLLRITAEFGREVGMTQQESEYDQWVRLANDPAQTEETRRECRAKMDAYLKERLRREFELVAQAGLPKAPE